MNKCLSAIITALVLTSTVCPGARAGAMDVLFNEGLHSDDGTVQDRAISLFKDLVVPKHLPYLRKLLRDKDERLVVLAIEYLVKFNDRSVLPRLIKMAEDVNATITNRSKAIWAIGEFGASQYIDKLMDVLELAVKTNKRLLARTTISTLAKLNAKQALPKFLELYDNQFKRKDYQTYLEPAILSLGGAQYLPNIQKNNVSGQYSGLTLQAMAEFNRPMAIEEYFKHDEVMLWKDDVGAFSSFVSVSCDLSCLRLLQKKDKEVGGLNLDFAKETAKLVANLGKPGLGRFIYKYLTSDEPDVKKAVADALASLGGNKNIRRLASAFLAEKNMNVKVYFAEALAKGDQAEALSIFARALRSGDDLVRKGALTALEKARTPVAVRAILDSLSARNPRVRIAAAEALGRRGDTGVSKTLLSALSRERHEGVQAAIIKSLGTLRYKPALKTILRYIGRRSPKALRITALEAASEIGGRAIYKPVSFIVTRKKFRKDCDIADLKAAAYRALGASGRPGAFRILKDVIESYPAFSWELPPRVRAAAIEGLGRLGNRKGVDVLLKLNGKLKEKDREILGDAIVRAMAMLGGRKADRFVLDAADRVTFNLNAYKAMSRTVRFKERAAQGLIRYFLQTDLTNAQNVERFIMSFLKGYISGNGKQVPGNETKRRKSRRRRRRHR
ncbi:MAG: hypothetical protein GXP49_05900 [Deltaproteobacteria bacterium]|nr:hypothetical protein [Deltaproteobacteria bacterium]